MQAAAPVARQVLAAVVVGCVWGCTNPFIKRGSQRVEALIRREQQGVAAAGSTALCWLSPSLAVPWAANQAASLLFVLLLGQTDISVAVPVANAISIAANAVVDMLLGEGYRVRYLLPGCLLVGAGILLCTTAG